MQALEKYRPFKSTGSDFSDSNPIFSYYFYLYFLEMALDISKNVEDPAEAKEIQAEIKETEGEMSQMQKKSQLAMDRQQNMTDILEYT